MLAKLLSILANGSLHWYIISGDPSANISLCKMLGFFSQLDCHACLVSKNLTDYKLNRKTREMEVDMLFDNWTSFFSNQVTDALCVI